jgi:predicted phage transcriptional regulator
MNIGENIKTIRTSKGLTQRDLATKLNITQQSIAQYENGKRIPKLSTVRKIANALNVSLNEIITDNWNAFTTNEISKDFAQPSHKDITNAIKSAFKQVEKNSPVLLNGQELSETSIELIRIAIKHAFEEVENKSIQEQSDPDEQ